MNSSILLKLVIKGTMEDSSRPIYENSGLALGGPRRMSCTRTGLRGCIWNVWDQRSSKDAPRDHDLDTAARHLDPSGPKPAQGPDTFPNFFFGNRRNHESPPKNFSRRRFAPAQKSGSGAPLLQFWHHEVADPRAKISRVSGTMLIAQGLVPGAESVAVACLFCNVL